MARQPLQVAASPDPTRYAAFTGEGGMLDAVNRLDWTGTLLGPIDSWRDGIRAAVSIALNSTFPLLVLSGPELVYVYNDASSCIFGDKHPWALGQPASIVWAEVWPTIGPMLHSVLETGRALRHDDLLLVLPRRGFLEECYFTFSYSAIRESNGEISGVFVAVLETSERVINERRLRTLGELAAKVASERGHEALAERFKVVVVDDDEDIVRYLRRLLPDSCHVVWADNAVSGLTAIREVQPDIVLLDVMMPCIDGCAMLRTMRADSQIQAIPVIVLSAHVGEDARLDAISAGADDYLAKPFSGRELVAMVRSQIRLVRIRRSAMQREGLLLTQIARVRHELESVIDGTSDAFVSLDHELRILALNEVSAELKHLPRHEIIGRLLAEVEPASAPIERAARRAMSQKRTIGLDYYHPSTGRWLHVRCYPARHGVIVFGNDITAQKRVQSRLRTAHAGLERMVVERTRKLDSANQLLKTVFDQAPAAIVMTDVDGRIVRANAAFQQLVGFSERKLRALSIQRFSDAADSARKERLLQLLLAGSIPNFEVEMDYRRSDASVIRVENVVAMIGGEDGSPLFIVEIAQDITARTRAEQEIRASQSELRELYERLQRVRKDERIALARDVHDQLGQILSAAKIDIKLLLDDIESRQGPLSRPKLVAELRSANTALDRAIGSVRSIATELRPPQIANQGLYSALAWHARDLERRTRIAVTLSLPETRGGPGGEVAEGLFRIFQEALTNVVRHARASAVMVSLAWRGDRMLLRVRDNGVGLSTRRRAEGTLGLVGMRERAVLAGGRVGFRRLGAGGTLVSALLPLATPSTNKGAL